MNELLKENDNLKQLLLINHDFTADFAQQLEQSIKAAEDKQREAELKAWQA